MPNRHGVKRTDTPQTHLRARFTPDSGHAAFCLFTPYRSRLRMYFFPTTYLLASLPAHLDCGISPRALASKNHSVHQGNVAFDEVRSRRKVHNSTTTTTALQHFFRSVCIGHARIAALTTHTLITVTVVFRGGHNTGPVHVVTPRKRSKAHRIVKGLQRVVHWRRRRRRDRRHQQQHREIQHSAEHTADDAGVRLRKAAERERERMRGRRAK